MSTSKHNSSFLQQLGIKDSFNALKNKLSKKEIKHYLRLGGQNYANLQEKVPILDADGKQLRFKVGGKTVLEMLKPFYKDGYTPVPGTEHIFVKPSFSGNQVSRRASASGERSLFSKGGKTRKQNGGNAMAILPIIGVVLYILIQAGNSGSFASQTQPAVSNQPNQPTVNQSQPENVF